MREYEIHLINNQVVKAAEQRHIPEDKRFHNRFRASKPGDVLTIRNAENGRLFFPVRNILYISMRPDSED